MKLTYVSTCAGISDWVILYELLDNRLYEGHECVCVSTWQREWEKKSGVTGWGGGCLPGWHSPTETQSVHFGESERLMEERGRHHYWKLQNDYRNLHLKMKKNPSEPQLKGERETILVIILTNFIILAKCRINSAHGCSGQIMTRTSGVI